MTAYYRVSDGRHPIELTPEEYAARSPNKQADLRLWIVDAQPVPGASEVVTDTGIVVGPVEAHQTWGLRSKTADELEADALQTEKAQIADDIAAINVQLDITNALYNAMTNAQKLDVLRDDRRIVLKALKFLLRQAKRAL